MLALLPLIASVVLAVLFPFVFGELMLNAPINRLTSSWIINIVRSIPSKLLFRTVSTAINGNGPGLVKTFHNVDSHQ